MTEIPKQICLRCGNYEIVTAAGKGFPPNRAKQRLTRRCKYRGHVCEPRYISGDHFKLPCKFCGSHTCDGMCE